MNFEQRRELKALKFNNNHLYLVARLEMQGFDLSIIEWVESGKIYEFLGIRGFASQNEAEFIAQNFLGAVVESDRPKVVAEFRKKFGYPPLKKGTRFIPGSKRLPHQPSLRDREPDNVS